MLSPREIATIRAEIKRLERAREECNDGGIQKRIDAGLRNRSRS